ncbi:sulfite exporter TauE/SafE family protein [Clostridium sp. OS1-26]|uniref:sulfite exporter TauE/SafE family protein n=1 Tax=Clostridium sp. OS1-26 TaxID=3070681 RepID=UPI0027E0DDE7|nr:sulfite exporter TauE/SafE family protein [Clostridium sp. OS1-26]WML33834.1 sulfite exporter TauE/SafE family protein [Clostridium sp. OS1-26]
MTIIYFLIALIATTVGSMVGLGGGVIIKPLLDFLGHYNVSTISILSSSTVFAMSVVSIIKQIRYKFKIDVKRTVLIGTGSVIGGVLGDSIMHIILNATNEEYVALFQNIILALLIIFVYVYMNNMDKYKSYRIKNLFYCMIIGLFLGFLGSFLSVGGGPINVCILIIFFSMDTKEAAVNSIITILFSQGAKLIKIITTIGLYSYNLNILPYMIAGGVIGGICGTKLNKNLSSNMILRVFNVLLLFLILLNIYNIVKIEKILIS